MTTPKRPRFTALYGMTVVHPEYMAKILPPPPMTLREKISCALGELMSIVVPSFWFAVSITAFQFAFGRFG